MYGYSVQDSAGLVAAFERMRDDPVLSAVAELPELLPLLEHLTIRERAMGPLVNLQSFEGACCSLSPCL